LPPVGRSTSSSASASAVLVLAALTIAGCGHQHRQQSSQNAHDLLVQAQQGLSRIHSGTVTARVRAETPVPLQHTPPIPAHDVPISRLRLMRWTRNPSRVTCGTGLTCIRADVDVQRALGDLGPILPSQLPVKPSSVQDAVLRVALRDGRPVYLKLTGKVDAGFLLGDVPFEAELDLPKR